MSDSEGRLFIGGQWVEPSSTEWLVSINPATEQESGRVPAANAEDVDRAVAAAREAFDRGPWPRMSVEERGDVLREAAAYLREHTEEIARVITSEMGSPIAQSIHVQVPRAYQIWEYFADLGKTFQWTERRDAYDVVNQASEIVIQHEPIGVVAAIVPWNGPQIVAAMKCAPALISGCTVVLKPSEEAALSFSYLAEAFRQAGLPEGVLNIVPADRVVSEHLVSHPDVDKVSITGSVAAGKRVNELCAAQMKHCTLELGGKSAAILLDDVDLDVAMASLGPIMAFINGQACNAPTRLLVPRSRYDEYASALVEAMRALPYGDPTDMNTFVGPLASRRQRDRVASYLELGKQEGATVALGGGIPSDRPVGWYVEKTVFTDVDNSMRIAQEEIFGPVYCVIAYEDEADAIRIANDTPFGLAGSVWTSNPKRGFEVARQVVAGTVGVNSHTIDMAGPFGGMKDSGFGRECGTEGIADYTQLKTLMPPVGTYV
jgi:betaine-aldehyde dehydrogenase